MGSGEEQLGGTSSRDESREVADSNDNGHCAESRRDGEEEAVPREHRSEVSGGMPKRTSGQPTRWPARPGEEQYEWEEPRVLADSKHKRSVQSKHSTRYWKELSEDRETTRRSTETQANDEAQSDLGGAVDGLTHRVDRLSLLGNGIVTQNAQL